MRDWTDELLLALCNGDLSPAAQTQVAQLFDQPIDWPRLAELAALHGVVGLVRRKLIACGVQTSVPAQAWQTIDAAATQIIFDAMLHQRELARMVAALRHAGIQPLLLKGQALADLLYDDALIRPASDIDLLIRREEVAAAQPVLAAIGYAPRSAAWLDFELRQNYHISLWREAWPGRPVVLELHWELGARELFCYNLDDWRSHAQPFVLAGETLQRFSIEDQLLHLALHMRKHRYVGLRWLVDVAELLRRFRETLDWAHVVETAEQAGLRTLLYTTVSLAGQLLAAPVPPSVVRRLEPSSIRRWLLRSVLTQDALLTPVEMEEAGWTRLAPVEVLLLDRPTTMARELGYRLFPPIERLAGPEAGVAGGQQVSRYVQRLARRTTTLLHRPPH